jgi:hypothetical protein
MSLTYKTFDSGEIDETSLPGPLRAWILQKTCAAITRTRDECEIDAQQRVKDAIRETEAKTSALVRAELQAEIERCEKREVCSFGVLFGFFVSF